MAWLACLNTRKLVFQNIELAFAYINDFYLDYLEGNNTFTNLVEQKVILCTWDVNDGAKGKKRLPCTNASIFASFQKQNGGNLLRTVIIYKICKTRTKKQWCCVNITLVNILTGPVQKQRTSVPIFHKPPWMTSFICKKHHDINEVFFFSFYHKK